MSGPENKDKIKEILEGHNKKFTAAELIVGIVVLLVIGCVIGYAIFKILTPKQITPNNVITKVQQPPVPKVTENKKMAVNVSSKKQVINTKAKTGESKEKIGNNTEISITNNIQNKGQNEQTGPKIITPEAENNINNNQLQNKQNAKVYSSKQIAKTKNTTPKEKMTMMKQKARINVTKKYTIVHHRVTHKYHGYIRAIKYVIQVSSNKIRKLALLNVIKLRRCGHNAFTKEVEVKGAKYTRVYVGPIKGYSLAKEEAKEIKRQLHLKYFPLIKKDD